LDTSTLISAILNHYDQVSSSDGDNTTRRTRLLQFSQEAFDEVWNFEDWPFTYITATVTVTAAASSADLPADFMEYGAMGGIWDNASLDQLSEWTPVAAYDQVIKGQAGDNLKAVANFGTNTSTGRFTINLPGPVGSTMTLKLLYRKLAPTLVDTTGTASNLWQIPAAYHNTVLVPRVASKTRASHGDSLDYMTDYNRNLGKMVAREIPRKTTIYRMPRTASAGNW
jgi:hypothetical protein